LKSQRGEHEKGFSRLSAYRLKKNFLPFLFRVDSDESFNFVIHSRIFSSEFVLGVLFVAAAGGR
jgi:hypothetical protein